MAKQKIYDSLNSSYEVEVEEQGDGSKRQVVKVAEMPSALVLPTGAATAAKQDTSNASLTSIDEKLDDLIILSSSSVYTLKFDDVGGGVNYIGEASPGTADSAASWRIKKITDTGNILIEWADGGTFSQVWDDREELTYE